jgi:hypothetical protein
LRRNTHNDGACDNATYTGFDIFWEDGRPVQTSMARMCGIAVRHIFGHQIPSGDLFPVQFHIVPQENPYSPRLALPRRFKPRRVYFQRLGPTAVLHLANGYRTDVVFHEEDDPRMLQWVGLAALADGEQQWVDLVAFYEA